MASLLPQICGRLPKQPSLHFWLEIRETAQLNWGVILADNSPSKLKTIVCLKTMQASQNLSFKLLITSVMSGTMTVSNELVKCCFYNLLCVQLKKMWPWVKTVPSHVLLIGCDPPGQIENQKMRFWWLKMARLGDILGLWFSLVSLLPYNRRSYVCCTDVKVWIRMPIFPNNMKSCY